MCLVFSVLIHLQKILQSSYFYYDKNWMFPKKLRFTNWGKLYLRINVYKETSRREAIVTFEQWRYKHTMWKINAKFLTADKNIPIKFYFSFKRTRINVISITCCKAFLFQSRFIFMFLSARGTKTVASSRMLF